jgi:hypothetical protein
MRLLVVILFIFTSSLIAEEDTYPLCAYMANYTSPENLAEVARQGFNIVRPATEPYSKFPNDAAYIRRFLDEAQRCGLKVIFPFDFKDRNGKWKELRNKPEKVAASLWKDPIFQKAYCKELRELIQTFKNHPALFAWELQDELNSFLEAQDAVPFLTAIREADGRHPVLLNLYLHQPSFKTGNGRAFLSQCVRDWSSKLDILSYDSYPHSKIGFALEHVDITTKFVTDISASPKNWHIIKAFTGPGDTRPPTLHDVRYMCYASIVNGINGLGFYHTHSSNEAMRVYEKVLHEINDLSLVITSGETVELSSNDKKVSLLHKIHAGTHYVFVVNHTPEERSVEFNIAGGEKEATVLYEARKLSAAEGKLNDKIEPYGAHVYTIKVLSGVAK